MVSKYFESEEMYLETILLLQRKRADVHAIHVAEELGYSRPSVSRGVNLLVKKGYIAINRNGEIQFTESGKKRAESVYERHTVITDLLIELGADRAIAEENACRIEHVITPELFDVLKNYVKKPESTEN